MSIRKSKKPQSVEDRKKISVKRKYDFQVIVNKYDLFKNLPKNQKIVHLGYNGYEDIEWIMKLAQPKQLDIVSSWSVNEDNRFIQRINNNDYMVLKSKTARYPSINIMNLNESLNIPKNGITIGKLFFSEKNIYNFFDSIILQQQYMHKYFRPTSPSWNPDFKAFSELDSGKYLIFPIIKRKFLSIDDIYDKFESIFFFLEKDKYSIKYVAFDSETCLALQRIN